MILSLLLLACGSAPEPPQAAARPPHVVVITLDTTRADRLGSYGYDKARTPTLDALAAQGRRYSAAYSPLPLTIPAHSCLFTGKMPSTLGIRDNGSATLGEEQLTQAEILHEQGYSTAASVAAFVTTRRWGFDQGFDAYFDTVHDHGGNTWHAERPGAEVVDDALEWIAAQSGDQPQFLWVHLYDPHFPYAPPPEHLERAEGRPYDGELAYVDDQVARLVKAYEGQDVLWVVAGDHGEGLGDHGELTHGLFVYQTAMHVPLIVAGHGVEPGVVDQPISLSDVMPTVLDHLELPVPQDLDGAVIPGASSRPLLVESYQLFSRWGIAPHVGVVDGDLKLIDLPQPELYDLSTDPTEQTNLATDRPEEVARLSALLEAMEVPPPGEGEVRDPALAMQLEALGYVEGGYEGELSDDLPDPKDKKRLIGLSQRADRRMVEQDVEEAAEVLSTLVDENPEIHEFKNRYATALARSGRVDEALVVVEAALAEDPDSVALRYSKAGLLANSGHFREASELFQSVADEMTWSPRVRAMAVNALMSSPEDYAEGFALGQRYLAEHPEDSTLAGRMGVEYARKGEVRLAIDLLKQGLEAEQPEVDVGYTLATLAKAGGDWSESRRYLELELKHHPRNLKAATALLEVQGRFEDWEAQVRLSRRMLDMGEPDAGLYRVLAQALFNLERYDEARVALDKGLALQPEGAHLMLLDANLMMKEGVDKAVAEERFRAAEARRAEELAEEPKVQLDAPRPTP